MRDPRSPIAELAQQIESALAARRARLEERIQRVEKALASYRLAAETRLAKEFAGEHGFRQDTKSAAPTAEQAARALLAAVAELPELAGAGTEARGSEGAPEELASRARAAAGGSRTASKGVTAPAPSAKHANAPSAPSADAGVHPRLTAAVQGGQRLVVVGALSGRDRAEALPPELAQAAEWIDTEREGHHAIGNLPQRVRQGRVAALVILHRAVGHRHTEAVMAAARDVDVPLAFAGQGGKASLQRALVQLELALSQQAERSPRPARARSTKKS